MSVLYPPFQYQAPDQTPTSYLEATRASHLGSGVLSESALPALTELMACHDTGHPGTLSLSHIPEFFFCTSLLLPTLAQLSLISSVRPPIKLVSQRYKHTDPSSCLLHKGGGTISLSKYTYF